jgi:hypothetical protein
MKYDTIINACGQFNSCKGCNRNLSSNDPASQYQRQKLIQNTVRVASSLYTMNLEGLSSYQYPLSRYQLVEQAGTPYVAPPSVNWNQMSDRAKPANQVVKTGSGSTYHVSSTRHTIVRNRPGAMSPGGIGVDIKHNSYERRLNKLKGKSVLRRGIIPPAYGVPIPFNRAYPVYGGKVVKTSIVNGCSCNDNKEDYRKIFEIPSIQDEILSVTYKFNLGDYVLVKRGEKYYKAQIIDIVDEIYTIQFIDDKLIKNVSRCELNIDVSYKCDCECECRCNLSIEEIILKNSNSINDLDALNKSEVEFACFLAKQVIQE